MRIQLQQRSSGTIHHASLVLETAGGVTTKQLVAGTVHALREHASLPGSEQGRANSALKKAKRWIEDRPPEGVSGRFSKSFLF